MTQQTHIKTLEDGSIDYAHYITRSHFIRSDTMHRSLERLVTGLNHLTAAILAAGEAVCLPLRRPTTRAGQRRSVA